MRKNDAGHFPSEGFDKAKYVSKMQLMELSQFSDYSLRVLIYTGLSDGRATAAQIAQAYAISQHHLVKVVHHLAKEGFLQTYRGRGGGFRLAKAPHEVTVAEIIQSTENLALVECLPPREGDCCLTGCCTLKGALVKARQAFLDVLRGYTLADLLAPRTRLRDALKLAS